MKQKLTGKVLLAAFLLNQVTENAAKILTVTITSMTSEEMAAFKYYVAHNTFIGL